MTLGGSVLPLLGALAAIFLSAWTAPAQAWDQHAASLAPWVVEGLRADLKAKAGRPLPAPCGGQDSAQHDVLKRLLLLNPAARALPTVPAGCPPGARKSVTGLEILRGPWVDEPDHGMDEDLPEALLQAADPNGDRRWMGGSSGPTSKGFRHMYFGGLQWLSPIRTFQVPMHPIGRNPWRAEQVALAARDLIRNGNPWGYRVLAWATHYVQDISQPFHAAQVPHWRMVPWFSVLDGFDALVSETTHSITNYHWAYEGYVRDRLKEGRGDPLEDCVSKPAGFSRVKWDPRSGQPLGLALQIAALSVERAPAVGSSVLKLFGLRLRTREVDFPKLRNVPDGQEIIARPDLGEARQALHEATCPALADAVLGSQLLIEWALEPSGSAI